MCAWCVYMRVCTHLYMHTLTPESGYFLLLFSALNFKTRSPIEPEASQLARLAGQWALWICQTVFPLSLLLGLKTCPAPDFYIDSGDLNSSPHASMANTVPMEPFPQDPTPGSFLTLWWKDQPTKSQKSWVLIQAPPQMWCMASEKPDSDLYDLSLLVWHGRDG